MSRLTKRVIDEVLLCDAESSICKEVCKSMDDFDHPCDVCPINEAIKKLAHYEDLEEQGKLVELPCLPNEEVWESSKRFGTHKTMYASREAIVGAIEAGYAIGYTKEEAEAKLAEMEGGVE